MVVRRHPETGERHLDVQRWGLVPHFHKGELKAARQPINARSETAGSFGLFRGALAVRQPYAIARTDGAPLAFAGVWEGWRAPDGAVLRS